MLPKLSLIIVWCCLTVLVAQAQTVFTLTAEQLQNGQAVELDKLGWRYAPGDDPRFAEPQFDDRQWETLNSTAITPENLPKSSWHGIGWFRLHLRVAQELTGQSLNLEMSHLGAAEIYLNGKQIGQFGTVGLTVSEETAYNPNATPLSLVFPATTEQVVAIRYSNQKAKDLGSFFQKTFSRRARNYGGAGFRSQITRFGDKTNQGFRGSMGISYNLLQGAIFFSFGALYFLLFVFFSRLRVNLFYSIFLLASGVNGFCLAMLLFTHFRQPQFYFLQGVVNISTDSANLPLLAFLYVVFWQRILRRFWVFFVIVLAELTMQGLAIDPLTAWMYNLFNIAFIFEPLRIVWVAYREKLPGAKIIGAGIFLYSLTPLREFLNYFMPMPNIGYVAMDAIANYGGMLAFSIYLAREFANTNRSLEEQLVQVKQLSAAALEHEKVKAENERRAAELEEARQLQLSMLPKKLPQLPHLDIAAYMKTASEVGGDYYDFHTSEDGTLTIAVGDATGHGLKAGTLVSSVKSLFVSLAYHPDIPHIFARMSRVLKEMKLRGLFMAMTMVKVRGTQMSVSIAGMPSVLIYRAASQTVEEIAMRALPLGGVTKYQYQQQEWTLAPADVVVLMSDGLPERFNANDEMLEHSRIQQALPALATQSAEQIIAALVRLGEDWSAGRAQDDDITFVVLRVNDVEGKRK